MGEVRVDTYIDSIAHTHKTKCAHSENKRKEKERIEKTNFFLEVCSNFRQGVFCRLVQMSMQQLYPIHDRVYEIGQISSILFQIVERLITFQYISYSYVVYIFHTADNLSNSSTNLQRIMCVHSKNKLLLSLCIPQTFGVPSLSFSYSCGSIRRPIWLSQIILILLLYGNSATCLDQQTIHRILTKMEWDARLSREF